MMASLPCPNLWPPPDWEDEISQRLAELSDEFGPDYVPELDSEEEPEL